MSYDILVSALLEKSTATDWAVAMTEWKLLDVYDDPDHDTCSCSHYPIRECCVLTNKVNGNNALVGNCCVKNFIGLPSDRIFQAIKRIRKDKTKALNLQAIDHGLSKAWLTRWEYDFYCNTMRKRALTDKQMAKRIQINLLFLHKMEKHKQ